MIPDPAEIAAERDAALLARADGPSAPASWWIRLGGTVKAFPFGYKPYVREFRPDALDRIRTDDGEFIALARYAPRGQRRFREPVVLCHGHGANRFTFDLDERYSLARRLAERGFETWIVELRGRGEAGEAQRISFDRQTLYDVGAALRSLTATGAPGVLWVGHSKGGLLPLAHLGIRPTAPIRAVVTLGTPTTFALQRGLKAFARVVRPLLDAPKVPIQNLARLSLFVPPPEWFMQYLVYSENIDPEIRKLALVNVGADVAGGVARQFFRWANTGRWDSEDGTIDYERSLANVRVPTLLIAGSRDLFAPPDAVAHALGHLGGPAELLVAGRDNGFLDDYGHGDLVLGRHAPEDLYPRIAAFLESHASPVSR
ncbi:MAG: alpha/beta hydrolase [Myxococcaceae bacterium]|nr:alpha/beta hydrolase [Myxococcaceae bacterium]